MSAWLLKGALLFSLTREQQLQPNAGKEFGPCPRDCS